MILIISGILLLGNACGYDADPLPCTGFEWDYSGEGSPEYWIECFVDCSGTMQSPLNITGAQPNAALEPLELDYDSSAISIVYDGKVLQFNYDEGSTFSAGGPNFTLLSLQFHTRSEHSVNGKFFPMEMQLIHQRGNGRYAVISLLFENGNENAFLQNFVTHLPSLEGGIYQSPKNVNVATALPPDLSYFHYSGSLTYPPCSENVEWFILREAVEASNAQIQAFRDIMGENYRPLQEQEGRVIGIFE